MLLPIAMALEHERSDEGVAVEGINDTHALGAMARLLPPTRLALGTPAIRPGFIVVHPGFIQIHKLFRGDSNQLRAKLLPLLFLPLRIPKGLFLCV